MTYRRSSVAVLGSGLIGADLAGKLQRSLTLDCRLVAGRNQESLGLRRAAEMGCPTSDRGLAALLESGPFDVVFDASNADDHAAQPKSSRQTPRARPPSPAGNSPPGTRAATELSPRPA
ncbi:hypothetical protein Sru01_15850 [Sphaerisporangium rufum]|uniref:Uncharacterized protein n=1 Tax=Sphaerisporangium rufum TaxID=1381558 RepID=A0A919V0E3_9ACTN|nr:hypothetical protein Sru01_15850 [Sphaerisporangium rufum]